METIQQQIDRYNKLIDKRAAKGFDNSHHIERVEHLKHCLDGDHEFTEAVYAEFGESVVMCLWCDEVKK